MGLFNWLGKSRVKVDDADLSARFADLTDLTATAEAVIIDFGLQPKSSALDEGKIVLRVATNLYNAKRFMEALRLTVERHEDIFGTVKVPTIWEGGAVADPEHAYPIYANSVRVTGTPEELVLDFALNPQPFGTPKEVRVSHRVITTFSTAKRLLEQIRQAIRQYEARFGTLEMDPQRRMNRPGRSF